MVAPPNRDLLRPAQIIGTIAVARRPIRTRRSPRRRRRARYPATTVTFVEKLTPEVLQPKDISKPVKTPVKVEKPNAAAAAPSTVRAAAARRAGRADAVVVPCGRVDERQRRPDGPARRSAAAGGARSGASPASRRPVKKPRWSIAWQPPASSTDEAPGVLYNVYAAPSRGPAPVDGALARRTRPAPCRCNVRRRWVRRRSRAWGGAGKEKCFVVRSVATGRHHADRKRSRRRRSA